MFRITNLLPLNVQIIKLWFGKWINECTEWLKIALNAYSVCSEIERFTQLSIEFGKESNSISVSDKINVNCRIIWGKNTSLTHVHKKIEFIYSDNIRILYTWLNPSLRSSCSFSAYIQILNGETFLPKIDTSFPLFVYFWWQFHSDRRGRTNSNINIKNS